ncbi:MAG TPA: oligosaccharide flippase family protein [Oscillatoriales cyanobacterium M4454_W2019_049]|nr:oligosaccharide flippase family protein [Oscillatoriales cyanobacterium M4454_W2019_049]
MLAKGAIVALILQVFGVVASYGAQIVLARWMGTTEYGIYEYVFACALLLAILSALGLPGAVLRLIPEYQVKQETSKLRGLLRGSLPIVFGMGLAIAAIGSFLLLELDFARNWTYSQPLLVGLWLVPFLSAIDLQSEMARTVQRIFLARAPLRVVFPIVLVLIAFFARHNRVTLNSFTVLGASIMALAAIAFFQFWQLDRIFQPKIKTVQPIYNLKDWFAVALPLLLGNSFFIILNQTDVLMLGIWGSPAGVGIYSAAARTALWVSFVLQAVNTVVAPMFSTLYARGDRSALQALVSKTARWMLFPTILGAGFVIVYSEAILSLFGSEFVAAQGQAIVLVGGQCINALSGSVGYLLAMTGYQTQSSKVLGYSALTNVSFG